MNLQSFSFFAILLICSAAALPSGERRNYTKNKVDISIKGIPIDLGYLKKTIVGVPSNETGAKVAQWKKGQGINPEELGEYAEGDILIPQGKTRNGMVARAYRWPYGVIPYVIDNTFRKEELALIAAAMKDYHAYTCIRFVPYNRGHRDYIHITNRYEGCYSSVGRIGGAQTINLQSPGCVSDKGTPIHELMHAVGFKHEQSRFERDDYVDIYWENINKNMTQNFDKAVYGETDPFGVPYDYRSVMHYSNDAFSINGYATVLAKGNSNFPLGQREGFSTGDIQKINSMYGCQRRRRWK